jgi:ectoine hydroxylase-related dioxygenase (phytanoyl-CoA dioxygenase family)
MSADPGKLNEVHERGFTVVPDVLAAVDIPILRELLEKCIREDLERWGKNPYYVDRYMVHNVCARHIAFARVLENAVLHDYLTPLLSETCVLYAYTSSSLPPRGTNYSNRIHVDCPRLIPGYVSNVGVMLALDDFTIENGATYFLPGSHTEETPPTRADFLADAERVFPRAGDMVLFNARTWHLGGENRTDRPRHALTLNVCRSYMRQRFDYPRLMPKEILDQLGETARRFLGFNVRVPTSLDEYYVPEDQRLYKPGQG